MFIHIYTDCINKNNKKNISTFILNLQLLVILNINILIIYEK